MRLDFPTFDRPIKAYSGSVLRGQLATSGLDITNDAFMCVSSFVNSKICIFYAKKTFENLLFCSKKAFGNLLFVLKKAFGNLLFEIKSEFRDLLLPVGVPRK